MSKAAKKRARRNNQARQMARQMPPTLPMRAPLSRRGRPPVHIDIGPTPETLAKHRPDTLKELLRLGVIDAALVKAGQDIERGYRLHAPGAVSSNGAGPGVDAETTDTLMLTYRRWCTVDATGKPHNELRRRCGVEPGEVVEWMHKFDRWLRDDRSEDGALVKALEWWRGAAREVGRIA